MLFAVAALMSGCIKDTAECAATDGQQLTLTIALPSSETVVAYATESGSAAENRIDNLYVTFTPTGGTAHTFTVDMSGAVWTTSVDGHSTCTRTVTVPSNIFAAGDRFDVMANFQTPVTLAASAPASPFYMSGEGQIAGSPGNFTASVHLVRGVAKIRMGVTAMNSGLLIRGVSVKTLHVPAKIRLRAPYTTDDGIMPSNSVRADIPGLTYIDYAASTLNLYGDFTETFSRADGTTVKAWPQYIYENWLDDESDYTETGTNTNVTMLEVTMQVQEQASGQIRTLVETIPIRTLESTSPDTYTYRIKRNHIYAVDVQVLSIETVKVNVDILPWKDVALETSLPEVALDMFPSPLLVPRNSTVTIPVKCPGVQFLSVKLASNVPAGYSLVGADPVTGILTPSFSSFVANVQVTTPQYSLLPAEITFIADNVRYTTNLQVKGTPHLTVSGTQSFPGSGGSGTLSVQSYISYGDGTTNLLPWTTEFSTDGGSTWSSTAPSWLTGIPASDPGSLYDKPFSYTVSASAGFNPHTVALRSASAVTNYDLSTDGGATAVNTANCYLVNAPGTYRLPLVYGNGIKNGATNASAYTSTASGSTILSHFLNHMGAWISMPYIYDNSGCMPSDCCLVWQDANGLVSNVHLSDDHHYLEFEVAQATICQGNAVVAVRDASNRIMWSWHIWVTDYKLGTELQTTTNYQGVTYKFLPYNIGWCDPQAAVPSMPAVSVQVRIIPDPILVQTPARTVTISRSATPAQATVSGNNPYFQWGRKDPMLPGLVSGLNGVDKSFFSDSGYAFGASNLGTSINSYIQNPHLFNTSYYMDNLYYNLWSANNTVTTANDNPVVKTIYDPSPVGFCMPPSNAWTGFTTTGNYTNIVSQIRGTWDSTVSPAGYNFDITGGTAYFPASGYRYGSSRALGGVGSHGYCWSAVPYSASNGRYLHFVAGGVNPLSDTYRGYGFTVRPVQE